MAQTEAERIAVAAASPKSATVDGQSISAHSLQDQIAADKHATASAAASGGKFPLRMFKIKPSGSV